MGFSTFLHERLPGLLWPLCLGLAAAWLATASADRPLASLEKDQDCDTPAMFLGSPGDAQTRLVMDKNILKLGKPLTLTTLRGPETDRLLEAEPANWRLLGVISGANPMAMVEIDGRTTTVRCGDVIQHWTLEKVTPHDILWRSGEASRTVPLFPK